MPESYKHLFAKQLLVKWLRDKACMIKVNTEGDHLLIALEPIRALVPITNKFKGVYEEYPICLAHDGKSTLHTPWLDNVPSYEELARQNNKPVYILDIAVLHMDSIKYGIEVVHTHLVPGYKVTALELGTTGITFELYSISAEWILSRCSLPYKLEMQRLIPGPRWMLSDNTNFK